MIKKIQSTDSTETCAYETREYITHVEEKIKRYNIVQKCLSLIAFQKKI